jgi:hypothetical protein
MKTTGTCWPATRVVWVTMIASSLLGCGCPGEERATFTVTDAQIHFLAPGTDPDQQCRQLCLLLREGIDATLPDGGFADPGWIRAEPGEGDQCDLSNHMLTCARTPACPR